MKGANYNLQDEFGNAAIHHAVLNNSYEAVANLINLKFIDIDVN